MARGIRARGLDVFHETIDEYCHPEYVLNGTVMSSRWSIGEIPFEDKSFDLVVSFDTLQFVPVEDIPRALKTMSKVAKKVLVYIPTFVTKKKQSVLQKSALTAQSRAWWARMFSQAGLQIDRQADSK